MQLFLLLSFLGGALAGFMVRKGVLEGLVAGFLAAVVGGAMLGILGAIAGLIEGESMNAVALLNGTIELMLLLATPAIFGGLSGGAIRKIQEAVRGGMGRGV